MKNKNLLIIVAVAVVVLIIGGGYFLFANKSAGPSDEQSQEENIQSLSPEEIGLTMELSSDNKRVRFKATKLEGFRDLEWEFFYDADIPPSQQLDDGADKVTQNFGGEATLTSGETSYESVYRELGTCSSGRCRFDTGIEKVNLILKLTKADGSLYRVEDSIEL